MTTRSPWPISTTTVSAPPRRGRRCELAGVAERDDRDHGVGASCRDRWCRRARPRCRGRRGSSSSRRCERLAQLGLVVRGERLPGRRQAGVGELLADHVGVHQAGHVDDPVVHLPALCAPRHVARPASRRRRRPPAARLRSTSTQAPRVSVRALERRRSRARPGRRRGAEEVDWKSMPGVYAENRTDVRDARAGLAPG